MNTITRHEIAPVSKETAPRMIFEGSAFYSFKDNDFFYTAAYWNEIELIDNMASAIGTSLCIRVKRCDQTKLTQNETCAD